MLVIVKELKFDMGVCDDADFLLDDFVENQDIITIESWECLWDPETDRCTAYLVPHFDLPIHAASNVAGRLQARWNALANQ